MKKGPFKIYIDRLKDDDTEKLFEEVDPSLLELSDDDLHFIDKIAISGVAYLAQNHLILELKIHAKIEMPCSICNEKFEIPLSIDHFTHTVEISEIKSSVYDFAEDIRTSLLLKVPQFVECNKGKCPQRKIVNKFLKTPTPDTYSPFSDLNYN